MVIAVGVRNLDSDEMWVTGLSCDWNDLVCNTCFSRNLRHG